MKDPNIITREELKSRALLHWPEAQVLRYATWGLRMCYYAHYVEYLERYESNKNNKTAGWVADENPEQSAKEYAKNITILFANKYRDEGRTHHYIFHPISISTPQIIDRLKQLCKIPLEKEENIILDQIDVFDLRMFSEGNFQLTPEQCEEIRRQFGHDSEYYQPKYPAAEQNDYVAGLFETKALPSIEDDHIEGEEPFKIQALSSKVELGDKKGTLKKQSSSKRFSLLSLSSLGGSSRRSTRFGTLTKDTGGNSIFSPLLFMFYAPQRRSSLDNSEHSGDGTSSKRSSKTSALEITLGDFMQKARKYQASETDAERSIFTDIAYINSHFKMKESGISIADIAAATLFPNPSPSSPHHYIEQTLLKSNGANEFATTISNIANKIRLSNNNPFSLLEAIKEIIDYAPTVPFRGEGHLNIMRDNLVSYILNNSFLMEKLVGEINSYLHRTGQFKDFVTDTKEIIDSYKDKPNELLVKYFIDKSFFKAINFAHNCDLVNFTFVNGSDDELIHFINGNYNFLQEVDGRQISLYDVKTQNGAIDMIKAISISIKDHQPGGFIYSKYENFMNRAVKEDGSLEESKKTAILFDTFKSELDIFHIDRAQTRKSHEEYGIKAPIAVHAHMADALQVAVDYIYQGSKSIDFTKLNDKQIEESYEILKASPSEYLGEKNNLPAPFAELQQEAVIKQLGLKTAIKDEAPSKPAHKSYIEVRRQRINLAEAAEQAKISTPKLELDEADIQAHLVGELQLTA